VINDHLGDAYWRVGRKREATFQWAHARDLDPQPDELPKILKKLESGLSDDSAINDTGGQEDQASEPQQPTALAAVDATAPEIQTIQVKEGESLSEIAERIFGRADAYTRILDANRDSITDPNLIYPGMTLKIPTVEAN
jgi:nucleoid-associated protein YgaU